MSELLPQTHDVQKFVADIYSPQVHNPFSVLKGKTASVVELRILKVLYCIGYSLSRKTVNTTLGWQRLDGRTFLCKFWHFQMAVSQWNLVWLTPNLGILWISVSPFWLCESIVANPIIYRLVPSPSRYEIRQCRRFNYGIWWRWNSVWRRSSLSLRNPLLMATSSKWFVFIFITDLVLERWQK